MSRYPVSPPPLSNQDTYTSWPGGVDPTARVYDSVGGKRVKSPRSPKRRRAIVGGKSPKSSGKLRRRRQTPKRRRVTRKNRKSCRRTRRH